MSMAPLRFVDSILIWNAWLNEDYVRPNDSGVRLYMCEYAGQLWRLRGEIFPPLGRDYASIAFALPSPSGCKSLL